MFRFVCVVLLSVVSVSAELSVSSVFQDSMVIQREMPVPVWGKASPGTKIQLVLNDQKFQSTTDEHGKWLVKISPQEAGGPYELNVSSESENLKLKDILIGEVWICSGQSNMDMGHRGIKDYKPLIDESAKLPIRSLMVEKFVAFEKQDSFKGTWVKNTCSSAVGASFAYYLQKALNVPVGIIQTSWGSSSVEGWMPIELTEKLPHFKDQMANFNRTDKEKVAKLLVDCRKPNGSTNWERKDNIFLRTRPNILYNAMMHPLVPFACRGIAWYQGEANTKSFESMLQYKQSLQVWVKELRKVWGRKDLHFMPVMLPAFGRVQKGGQSMDMDHPDGRSWAWMREAQLGILEIPNTGVANTIDLGDVKNIHPKDKKDIGRRLTHLALHNIHNKAVLPQGPTFEKVDFSEGSATVKFQYTDGIKTNDGNAPKGFWIAGEDKVWHKADAELSGSVIKLKSSNVAEPVAVRYAFSAFPEVNLINKDNLPAVPFRTDNWAP